MKTNLCRSKIRGFRRGWPLPFAMLAAACLLLGSLADTRAGTWSDTFSGKELNAAWIGDRDYFTPLDGALNGASASAHAPVPLRRVEVGAGWGDYVVQCRINVMTPNLLVCTKGALILRQNGGEGYVFALHVATKTIEVYRLSDGEMLLIQDAPLELQRWYEVRAELQGSQMSFFVDGKLVGALTDQRSTSGSVGLAVQDAMSVLYDDFTVSGPEIPDSALRISLSQNQIALSWPAPPGPAVLQSASSLTSPIQWTTIATIPAGSPGSRPLDLQPGGRYFRVAQ